MLAVGFGAIVNVAMVWISLVSSEFITRATNTRNRDIMDGIDTSGKFLQTC